jgi:Zn-dependent peptidase ImmA (M78 family)
LRGVAWCFWSLWDQKQTLQNTQIVIILKIEGKMARQQIPVTKKIITWARKRAGYSFAQLSKDFKKIEEWENPEGGFPTYIQLENLAEKFKIPVAIFFFPEPPDVPDIEQSFRTLGSEIFNTIPPRIRLLMRKAHSLQTSLDELNHGRSFSNRLITRDLSINAKMKIDEIAERVRTYLGVSVEQQFGWKNTEIALVEWRKALFSAGVYVFKDPFRQKDYSGFCLYDEKFPIIYINNTTTKTRQSFTLFHELAHLLFHTSGIDKLDDNFLNFLPDDSKKIEIICNRFASNFLVPEHAFEREILGKTPNEETATKLANLFNVSREFIFRKFLDRGLISKSVYRQAAKKWAAQIKSGTGGDHYNNKIAWLGEDYIKLAFGEFYNERINESQLADYLNTKPMHLTTLEDYVSRRAL